MLYILLYCEFNLSVIEYHVINEKMHFLLLYILKYAGVDSNILQHRREYD